MTWLNRLLRRGAAAPRRQQRDHALRPTLSGRPVSTDVPMVIELVDTPSGTWARKRPLHASIEEETVHLRITSAGVWVKRDVRHLPV